ncbi:MAG TPA: MBL fold metallo-hydrolase [Lacunisphaera sp.]|nr:MBL fold metallo-hydrolase [Lacunisphaera sp.]
MKIHVLPTGPLQTNGCLLTDARLGEAVLVDAPAGIRDLIRPLLAGEGCRLTELWLTHGHWDHTQEAALIKRELGVVIRAHRADQGFIETPEIQENFLGERLGLEGVKVDAWVEQGTRLWALGREFEVRHVPGHCAGSVLYYQAEQKVAFVGDTLFAGGVGRTDFPGCGFEQLQRSIREQIYTLPDDTIIVPGHGPHTAVGFEKETNPYVTAIVA